MKTISTVSRLREFLPLSEEEAQAVREVGTRYPWRVTAYYASLIDAADPDCPIRRQCIPDIRELDGSYGSPDPLDEEENSPVPGVIQVYPDRLAVTVTNRCPMYCRFCLRKRFRRDESGDLCGSRLASVLRYIRGNSAIRDVLLTGGDPLMFADDEIDRILGELRSIGHVEIIRIGTRSPCTWPERITESFASMAASHHPVWVNTQFNHPREVTDEAAGAVDRLLRAGIPVGNQSVLLGGVNDSRETMLELVRKLVRIRVRPYYLYQAQALAGTGHFVVPIERGIEIVQGLRGWTTGFAVPQYVLDTPFGKVPLNPDYLRGRTGDFVEIITYSGERWREYNPLVFHPERARPTVAGGSQT
ncbi:KamA family radical SAM protein [Candidatus Latescibacterota bacterium]